jgi:hypothetical protein
MSLDSATIATGIAALSISGVTVKNITETPQQVQPRDCPLLFPMPNGWKKGGNSEPADGPATFGSPTTRYWIFNRTYEYVYLHAPVGSGRGLVDQNPSMSAKEDAIVTALLALNLTDVDVKNVSTDQFGVITDPTGAKFHGFLVTIILREKVNP